MMRRPQVQKKKDVSKQFQTIFERCGDEIIKYLTLQEQSNLKKVCRITFYMVQCSQIWTMMVFDTDSLSQASTNEDSSYLKNSFYSKFGKSRPSTQESIRQEQWLIQPEEFRVQKPKFLKSKNTIEDNFLNDSELRSTIDVWILNLGQLEKQTKIELIQTDSLMQEISLWVDNINILKQLKQEIQLDHVISIMKMLKQRSILDIGFQRKQQIINEQLKHLVGDLEQKQQYMKELLLIKPIFQSFLQIKLGDFYEIQSTLWIAIDRLRQLKYFNLRKSFLFNKIFSITTKLFKVNISWMADLQNYDTNLQLLEQLQTFLNDFQQRSEILEIVNYRKGIDDMIKMLKLNKKLQENSNGNLGVQQMMNYYKQKQFDQFQDKVQWNEIYKQWKQKYQGQRKQPEEIEQKNEAMSFGLYQTKMNWSIQ